VLGDLGRDGWRAPIGRQSRRVVEDAGDAGVRRIPGQREVMGADDRVVDDARNALVNRPPLLAQVSVERRREQRMREANGAVLALDDVRDGCRLEHVCRNARPLQERLRRRAQRGGEPERLARRRGQAGEPRPDELVERLWNRERLERIDVRVEGAGELHREERIPTRPLVDAEQRLACEGPVEPVAQERVERADAERSHRQPLDALRAERVLQLRRLGAVDAPSGEQHEHTARSEPSHGERKCAQRGGVEPLHVVDGNEDRLPFAEKLQHVVHRHGERAAIDRAVCLLAEERDLECPPPRRRQLGSDVVEDAVEQIAQPHVSQAALGLGRPRRENAHPPSARVLDPRKPERRLANPRLALEHERNRAFAFLRPIDEGADRGEFLLPPDDLARHSGRTDRDRGSGKCNSAWPRAVCGRRRGHCALRPQRGNRPRSTRCARHSLRDVTRPGSPVDAQIVCRSATTRRSPPPSFSAS